MPELVPLSGSERSELPSATPAATPIDPSQVITVTVLLRRRAEIPAELINTTATVSTEELGQRYGADPADATHVADVLGRYGLTVTEFQLASRRLKVSGMIAAMTAAFGTTLSAVTSEHPDGSGSVTHRYRTGGLSVPAELSGIIVGVIGLDTRPQASPHFRRAPGASAGAVTAHATSAVPGAVPLTAPQVASFYDFPAGTDGTGQTIAIIELGGGYNAADLNTYFSGLNLSVPSVTAVDVDNGSNSPGQAADGEVELDIEVAGAVAPKASFVVYFAPNTDQGFIDAISDAVNAKPTPIAVSISWGGPESSWASQSLSGMNEAISDAAALGATVTVAAGDNGSSDNPRLPAAAPPSSATPPPTRSRPRSSGTSSRSRAARAAAACRSCTRSRPGRRRPECPRRRRPATPGSAARPSPAAASPTWPATPTRTRATRSSSTASRSRSAEPRPSPRSGRA
jgi:kumamolisin